jgi:opacity protein-like surface antigen
MTFRAPLTALPALIIALASSQASAAAPTMQPASANFGNFYVGASAGLVIPESTKISITGSVVTGSGEITYKNAAAFTGFVGYNITDNLAGEAELGYSSVDYDNISGTLTAGSLSPISGKINVSGHNDAVLGLFNAIVHPLGKRSLSPYVGAGVGFADIDSKVNSLSAGGSTASVNASQSETDLAVNGIAGVDLAVTDNLSIGGRYRYLWINSAASTTASGVTGKTGDFTAHVLTAQATLHF